MLTIETPQGTVKIGDIITTENWFVFEVEAIDGDYIIGGIHACSPAKVRTIRKAK